MTVSIDAGDGLAIFKMKPSVLSATLAFRRFVI
jgi:hypothetical protein